MNKEIEGVKYSIKNTMNGRRISITIHNDGKIVVAKSPIIPIYYIERMMKEKLPWVKERLRIQTLKPKKILAHYSTKDFKENKEKARALVVDKVNYLNRYYNYKIGKIYIRNQKSRWGSCSSKGNLNFNYKIIFLPPELADYLIVHEICHLGEMNHSKDFWKLVAIKIPDYKERRKALKMY